jgi:putative transposase
VPAIETGVTKEIPMNHEENDQTQLREQIALFRYGLIADLLHLSDGKSGLYRKLAEKAERDYEIPGTLRRRVAAETMRGWLGLYRQGGFDALYPRVRRDDGQARAIPQQVADQLLQWKEEKRELTVPLLIAKARESGTLPDGLELAPATVHRLLSRHGLMNKQPGEPTGNDRRRFSFDKAGELWMSDVMHGPAVTVDGNKKRKTYLLALLDDATRLIPYAAFALSENTAAFLPVLEQAIRRRGLSKRLYVDNGAVYRSHHLSLVCAKLGVTLIHARPYLPQGKGKIERFFRTVRMQLLPVLGEADFKSLDALNRRLWSWIEGEYHQSPHKGLDGETPADRWARSSDEVKMMGAELSELFLFEQKRRVQKDRTVSLRGVIYEVDAALVGEAVTLRFDPSRPGRPIQVWHRGKHVQQAKRLDAYANCFVKRSRFNVLSVSTPPDAPPAGLRLRDLDNKGGR